MKVATRFISLSEKEQINRVRKRAQGILLSSKRYSIDKIADILEVHRDTVSSWFQAWETSGIAGLFDKPKSGSPSLLEESDIKKIEEFLNKYPQSPKTILAKFIENTGKIISLSTLRRVIKKRNSLGNG